MLIRASIKLDNLDTYVGGSDLEEFKVFIAGILRWLKMNCLLGETSTDMQVNYLGACLTGEAQEWFYRNVEQYDHQICKWTLETVVQGLQKQFLHTLTHQHASNKFDMVSQGTKFKSSYLLSQDCTEVNLYGIAARYVVMVVSKKIWESQHNSHAVNMQWVPMVVEPLLPI